MTFFVSQIILYKLVYRAHQNTKWDKITILIDSLSKFLIIVIIYILNIDISLKYLLLVFLIASIIEYHNNRKKLSCSLS